MSEVVVAEIKSATERARQAYDAMCDDGEVWLTYGMPSGDKELRIRAYIAAAIEDAECAATSALRARVLDAVRAEHLHDATADPADQAYDQAIDDAVAAVERCFSEAKGDGGNE